MRKSILFVELRRLEIRGTFDGWNSPSIVLSPHTMEDNFTVERHFHKLTDFTFLLTIMPSTQVITRPTDITVYLVPMQLEMDCPYFRLKSLEKLMPIR